MYLKLMKRSERKRSPSRISYRMANIQESPCTQLTRGNLRKLDCRESLRSLFNSIDQIYFSSESIQSRSNRYIDVASWSMDVTDCSSLFQSQEPRIVNTHFTACDTHFKFPVENVDSTEYLKGSMENVDSMEYPSKKSTEAFAESTIPMSIDSGYNFKTTGRKLRKKHVWT